MMRYNLEAEAKRLYVDVLLAVGALRAGNRETAELARRLLDWRSSAEVFFELGRRHRDELEALMDAPPEVALATVAAPPAPDLAAWLESYEFYDLMQAYRVASLAEQTHVVEAFEAVKAAIRKRGAP